MSQTLADFWNSSKLSITTNDLEAGTQQNPIVYKGTLSHVKFSTNNPLFVTFTFHLDGSPENGDFSGQVVNHTFNLQNKEGEWIQFSVDNCKRFAQKLLEARYSHDYEELKEELENLQDLPVMIKVVDREYTAKTTGETKTARNVTAIPQYK